MRPIALTAAVFFAATLGASAQNFATHACTGDSNDHFLSRMVNGDQACEVRSATFPLSGGRVNVKGTNGSIEVIGEDRSDIALEARVTAHAGSASEAESIIREVTVSTGAVVEAHGPQLTGVNRNWSVSFRLRVPHRVAADLHTLNGSLTLAALNGDIRGETTNGSVHLDGLAGDVHVSSTNGSINARLDGATWQGPRLEATTSNGSIRISTPGQYSAHLIASTTNGSTHVNLPNYQPADHHHRTSIDTNLGAGGPTLQFTTTNGSITVQ